MLQTEPTYIKNEAGLQEAVPPNPFLCITQNRNTVYYQDGEFYTGMDERAINYDDVPHWFWEIVKNSYLCSDKGKEYISKLKLVMPDKKVRTKEEHAALQVKKATDLWKCDECDDEIPYGQKGVHIANHRRAEKRAKKAEVAQSLAQSK